MSINKLFINYNVRRTTISALSKLHPDWKEWVKVCLLKKIPTNVIAAELIQRKWFDAAVELMSQTKNNVSIPYIDISQNSIQLSDKEVSVVSSCFKPHIVVIDNFLSKEECEQLIKGAQDRLKRSRVINDADGQRVESTNRNSENMNYERGENDLVRTIESRIAELVNWPVENGERLVVIRYEDGGEYKPHYDYFNPNEEGSRKFTQKSGQRVASFLMFLSDVEVGGSTRFPEIAFEVRPKVGRAVFFCNVDFKGNIDPMTLHAGIPVTKGVKYLSTMWLREKPFD